MSDATTASITTAKDTSVTATGVSTASTYSAAELENASRRFSAPKECIRAALKEQKKTAFTMDEAATIVKNFLIREVKV